MRTSLPRERSEQAAAARAQAAADRAAYVDRLRLAGAVRRQMRMPDGRGRQRNAIGVVDPTGETAARRVTDHLHRNTTPLNREPHTT